LIKYLEFEMLTGPKVKKIKKEMDLEG